MYEKINVLFFVSLTLSKSQKNTDDGAEYKALHQHGYKREGHTEHSQQQVTDGQVQQEHVGHRPHLLMPDQGQNDQGVSGHGQQEDQPVRDDDEGVHVARVGSLEIEARLFNLGQGHVPHPRPDGGVCHVVHLLTKVRHCEDLSLYSVPP